MVKGKVSTIGVWDIERIIAIVKRRSFIIFGLLVITRGLFEALVRSFRTWDEKMISPDRVRLAMSVVEFEELRSKLSQLNPTPSDSVFLEVPVRYVVSKEKVKW